MDVFMYVSRLMQFPDDHILDLSKGFSLHQHSWINLLGGFAASALTCIRPLCRVCTSLQGKKFARKSTESDLSNTP